MKKFSEIMENNTLHNILERKNFLNDEELKKSYNEEDIPNMRKMDKTCVKILDEYERCLGFYEYLEKKKKK